MIGIDLDSLCGLAKAKAREGGGHYQLMLSELLHLEILQAMLEAGALETLTLRGATALRMCYWRLGFSGDLEFVSGRQFDSSVLDGLGEVIAQRVARFYGMDVELGMQTPTPGEGFQVGKWRAKLAIPSSKGSLIPAHAVNIEVAAVPARTRELLKVKSAFSEWPATGQLPASYNALLVPTESLEEIAADKVVAFGARKDLDHREVGDLWLLNLHRVAAPFALVREKLDDSGLDKFQFVANARARLAEILDPGYHAVFLGEIERFLDGHTFATLVRGGEVGSMLGGAAALVESAISVMGEPP